jgi:sirohydrochlorin ferrochelatase
MELAQPDFPSAIDTLVERGADRILVHLHFLGEGYHIRETLPALISAARSRHPKISIRVTDPLGKDPRIAEIVLDRMDDVNDDLD